jgi:Flp pilus assembly pilin Flp
MLNYYIKAREALDRLRTDNAGVVSLEYVIVGAVVCVVVVALFNGTGANTLNGALTAGFTTIQGAMTGLPTP